MNINGVLIGLAVVVVLAAVIVAVRVIARGRAARRDPAIAAERLHARRQGSGPGAPTAGFGNYDKGAGA
jgi:hypothetical protein